MLSNLRSISINSKLNYIPKCITVIILLIGTLCCMPPVSMVILVLILYYNLTNFSSKTSIVHTLFVLDLFHILWCQPALGFMDCK
jgi:uncharacterized membrane protein